LELFEEIVQRVPRRGQTNVRRGKNNGELKTTG
jgi:hypothetical protein